MKKTFISIILALVVILAIGGIWAYYISKTTNPWNARTIGEIPAPFGYKRVEAPAGSYAEYLRTQAHSHIGTLFVVAEEFLVDDTSTEELKIGLASLVEHYLSPLFFQW